MKIGYVINTYKYKNHKNIVEQFIRVSDGFSEHACFDMGDGVPFHVRYREIRDNGLDYLISFDTAGFELRTENDTLSYNNLGAKMAHLLFRELNDYDNLLRLQLNFSMFVYSKKKQEVELVKRSYPNIPNINLLEINEKEAKQDILTKQIQAWFDCFFMEIKNEKN